MPYQTDLPSAPALETIYRHCSIRKYSAEPVGTAPLQAILEAGRAASSSSFMQCVHIIRVTDAAIRQGLFEVASQQPYVREAPEFLVFCLDYAKHKQVVPDAQVDWTEALIIGAADAGIMAQNCLLAAEAMGLGGVYIGSLRNDTARVAELLGLPEYTAPLFGLCIGHPAQSPPYRPRMPLAMTVSENRYHPLDAAALAEYETVLADYYQRRSGLDLNWQKAVRHNFGQPLRPHILPFLHRQGLAKR